MSVSEQHISVVVPFQAISLPQIRSFSTNLCVLLLSREDRRIKKQLNINNLKCVFTHEPMFGCLFEQITAIFQEILRWNASTQVNYVFFIHVEVDAVEEMFQWLFRSLAMVHVGLREVVQLIELILL